MRSMLVPAAHLQLMLQMEKVISRRTDGFLQMYPFYFNARARVCVLCKRVFYIKICGGEMRVLKLELHFINPVNLLLITAFSNASITSTNDPMVGVFIGVALLLPEIFCRFLLHGQCRRLWVVAVVASWEGQLWLLQHGDFTFDSSGNAYLNCKHNPGLEAYRSRSYDGVRCSVWRGVRPGC